MGKRGLPPLPVRVAVLVGALGVLAGVVGLVTFRPNPQNGTGVPRTVLVGLPAGVRPVVEVLWEEDGAQVRQEARPRDHDDTWELPPLPDEASVTIEVRDASSRALLARRVVAPPRPTVIPVDASGLR